MSSFVLSTFAALLSPPAGLHSSTTTRNNPLSHISCTAASTSGFDALNVRPEMIDALSSQGITKPNPLQTRAIPAINGRTDLILGAQTGSGKTLTYLVPVMGAIKADEEVGGVRARPRRPRAIVLVPTRELALQVHDVAKSLSHHIKLSVALVHGGVPDGPQLKRLGAGGVDLLVATPGRLVKLMELNGLYLGDVRHVILDEVDTMFDAGFGPELDTVLKITTRDLSADPKASADAAFAGGAVQHLAVGATHPEGARQLYRRWLGEARNLQLDGTHTLPPQLRQQFLTCNGPDAKMSALNEVLGPADEEGKPMVAGRIVLFTNSQQSARFVDHELNERGYATANYHGAIPANERAGNYKRFVNGEAHVLVTTDLAARGLDNLDVGHVVQFDFAKSAADYVHRCGRTARAGKRGEVTSLVTKSDTELVRALRDAQKRGADLIAAGEQQQREAKQRAATELQPQASGPYRGKDAPMPSAAAFPDCRGISSHEEVGEGRGGAKGSPGGARGSGPKHGGRGGRVKLGRGGRGRGVPVGAGPRKRRRGS